MATTTAGRSAGGSVSDFNKMGKQSMEAELSINAPDSGVTNALSAVGGVLDAKRKEMDADYKAIHKEKQAAVDKLGKDIEGVFVEMGPEMKELGQVSYQKAQDDVYGLREAFVDCAGDKKCEADIMVKLNTTKTRHETDAENAKGLVGLWEGELDEDGIRGETSADALAMSHDERAVMTEFTTNKTKRITYIDDEDGTPVLNYQWEVPAIDNDKNSPTFGEQLIGPDGQPQVETKSYSNEELQDMVAIKQTVNGEKLQDFIQAEKEKKGNNQTVSDNAALKKSVGDMIPKDAKALKSWAYSNPAEQDYLNVHDYLMDHPILNGQYEALEIADVAGAPNPDYVSEEETPGVPKEIGDGKIDHADFINAIDRESIITRIMDAEDPDLTHSILTDIYASAAGNEISGLPKRASASDPGGGNVEYNPDRHVLPRDSNEQTIANEEQKANQEKFTKLQSLADPEVLKSLGGANVNKIAEKLGLDPSEKILNPTTGEMETIATYIANATNKKAGEGGAGSKYNKPE